MNRQEAINIVKKNWPDSSFTSLKEALEFLIPELMSTDNEKIKEAIIKGIIHAAEEGCFCADNYSVKECVAWLEKQGEYANFHNKIQIGDKPADKVEPRFKVGDWVVTSYGKVNQIVSVDKDDDDGYTLDDDTYFSGSWKDMYHLWTIQDAKDGDVLSYRDGQWIFIYKGIVNEDTFKYYALLSEKGITVNDEAFSLLSSCITPATKEQRDTLMKAMADAGYTFDFEKKELKKVEQKPVWNEEDLPEFESYLCLMFQKFRTKGMCTNGEIIDYVKEHSQKLKDALCHPWSKEDELQMQGIIDLLPGLTIRHNWLKSLKDRYTWKPSDEHMLAINTAINVLGKGTLTGKYLIELHEQLKKLREE